MIINPAPETQQQEESLDLLIRSDDNIQLNNQKSKRHSANVRRMRLIFPIIALGVIVMLITWKSDNAPVTAVPREKISPQTVSQNELINPKFQSEDNSGQPYSITADKATQNAEDMDKLHLQKPVADISLKSGGNVSLKAASGTYQQESRGLSLEGQVIVTHDSGYEIRTDKMNIDVKGQVISSDTPVTGHGSSADITASGLNVDGNSKIVTFQGPAKLILQKSTPAAAPTDTLPTDPPKE